MENEREWRRYIIDKLDSIESRLIVKIDSIEEDQNKMSNEIVGIKTWLWIWRGIGSTIVGVIFLWLKDNLK